MEQIRIIKELRYADSLRGRTGQLIRPRFMVWENVHGAFSSNKGEDFRVVLEEAARIVCPGAVIPMPGPTGGKWRNAGCILGTGWSIAWRVLDAQFWGVPQRRRRIALVVDFGGHAAPEVLFIRKGVSGDIEPCAAAGESVARETAGSTGETVTAFHLTQDPISSAECAPCLSSGNPKNGQATIGVCSFMGGQGAKARSIGYTVVAASTLKSAPSGGNTVPCVYDARGNGNGQAVSTLMGDHQRRVSDYTSVVCLPFDTTQITSPQNGCDLHSWDPCHPWAEADRQAVAVQQNASGELRVGTVANTLSTNGNASGRNAPLVMATGQGGAEIMRYLPPTLDCNHEQPLIAHTLRAKANLSFREDSDTLVVHPILTYQGATGTLSPGAHPGSYNGQDAQNDMLIADGMAVRRLTPLECERLQGYPGGWTDIGQWVDSKGKLHKESSDSARYKALGNSIALPPWAWVMKRIAACYERAATLGSFFDGIGGFPLIWERLNGSGSCLWASEIEEFPIAVTKARFGVGGQSGQRI